MMDSKSDVINISDSVSIMVIISSMRETTTFHIMCINSNE